MSVKALAWYWLPPFVWMATIWGLSTDVGSATHTSRLLVPLLTWLAPWATPAQIELVHGLVRKLGHLVEYAILAGLWFRTLRAERRLGPSASAGTALAVSIGWAILDELHQSTVPARTASAADVMLDSAGAALAVVAARLRAR